MPVELLSYWTEADSQQMNIQYARGVYKGKRCREKDQMQFGVEVEGSETASLLGWHWRGNKNYPWDCKTLSLLHGHKTISQWIYGKASSTLRNLETFKQEEGLKTQRGFTWSKSPYVRAVIGGGILCQWVHHKGQKSNTRWITGKSSGLIRKKTYVRK